MRTRTQLHVYSQSANHLPTTLRGGHSRFCNVFRIQQTLHLRKFPRFLCFSHHYYFILATFAFSTPDVSLDIVHATTCTQSSLVNFFPHQIFYALLVLRPVLLQITTRIVMLQQYTTTTRSTRISEMKKPSVQLAKSLLFGRRVRSTMAFDRELKLEKWNVRPRPARRWEWVPSPSPDIQIFALIIMALLIYVYLIYQKNHIFRK